ncbi:helix-turn-helix transcriptional regulator [Listeria aquatica]|uniref:Helix-turn-helix transcriptional regulator n=1 Tax=Listeria aquatica TaxID=1494960 RepID=A0A841ZQ26_9LIST|nr:helix-turn-helix transcriptional regulator [Listeria aquatica]MBC1521434.1 helix-turn-helix transcriptional regulator [Listeria aquatica]
MSSKNLNLIAARKNSNLTQSELAEQLGVRKSTISNWETGYSNPSINQAVKISEVLNENLDFLFAKKVQEFHTKKLTKV